MHLTRRRFVQLAGSSAVISLGGFAPRFLVEAAEAESGRDTVLVVVQMSGGNDGLNTIVPYADELYYGARPTLAIPREQVLKINDALGFHPALRPLADLLEAGQLAIVQGVGYPQPNRSHFESMDIWHTCLRKGQPRTEGWLGRYLDADYPSTGGDAPAVHLGGEKQPLALAARDVRVPSISSLDRFRLHVGGDQQLRSAIQELSAASRQRSDDLLGFIQSSTTSALEASRRLESAGRQYQPSVPYPESGLALKLQTVAQLIDAGLRTRVYYMEIDGFDTHSQQAEAHAALLRQLADAVGAFVQDVNQQGHGDRVLLVSFSEFGRRVAENASEGTDHGAAAPMLVAGQRAKAGLLGEHPSLADLADGDLKFHIDFRQVYAAVLENWLGWPAAGVLGGAYEPIDVIA